MQILITMHHYPEIFGITYQLQAEQTVLILNLYPGLLDIVLSVIWHPESSHNAHLA